MGVSRTASDDEIKKAYRALAKKYHPDNFTDEGQRARAEEKMKEINAAYERIQRGDTGSGQRSYTYRGPNPGGVGIYAKIRSLINANQLDQAEAMLANPVVDPAETDAAKARLNAIMVKIGEREAPKEEKEQTFLGKFIAAALAQKSMVTSSIYKSGNRLAGISREVSADD